MAATRGAKDSVFKASMIAKNSVEAEMLRASGGDAKLRNLRRKGSSNPTPMKLGFDIKGKQNFYGLLLAKGNIAAWKLVEYGGKAHRLTPRISTTGTGKGMSRKARQLAIRQRELDVAFGARGVYAGKRPMPITNGIYRYSAQNPGARAKHPWRIGLEKATPRMRLEMQSVIRGAIVDVWRSGRTVISNDRLA